MELPEGITTKLRTPISIFAIPLLFLTLLFLATNPASAVIPGGGKDLSFDTGEGKGFNSTVNTVAIQSDGKAIIGGHFTSYKGTERNYLTRLNSDASLDSSFYVGSGANNPIWIALPQLDGRIIIGGDFTSYNGVGTNRIARLNADGSLDGTFNMGTGANNIIMRAGLQSDGKIIIGGVFTSYNGTGINRIARLNADGSLDGTFNVGTGANDNILIITVQSDGKIIIGGGFTSYNDTETNRIARLNADGSLDSTFNVGTGANNTIYTTAVQSDGKVIIGGWFTSYNGTGINGIARLNADGSLDTSFNGGGGGPVGAITVQSDGKVIIGGWFTTYDGAGRNRIARLNADGSLDSTFSVGTGFDSPVNTLAILSNGKVIVGGSFTHYNGMLLNRIARLNADGSLDSTFSVGTGFDSSVNTLAMQSDGKVIVGGGFKSYNLIRINSITRINTDGSLGSTFNNVDMSTDTIINTIAIQSDGKVIVVGWFTFGIINHIARFNTDGSVDDTFNVGTGANNEIHTMVLQSDGKIIIGGHFTSYNGTGTNRIARLNADGSLDSTFNVGTGANNTIYTTAVQSDGKVIIGGHFTSYNGTGTNRIARLNADGSLDTIFDVGTGASSTVKTIATRSDGKMIIGGDFTGYNGFPSPYLIALLPDLYQADSVPEGYDIVRENDSLKVGTENGSRNSAEFVKLITSTNVPIAGFNVDFSAGDVDFNGVSAGMDLALGKSFVYGLSLITEVGSSHSLYVPKLAGHNAVYICPQASSLDQVSAGCVGGYLLVYGVAYNLSAVTIGGVEYWEVTGLTGTGGLSYLSVGQEQEREQDQRRADEQMTTETLEETGTGVSGLVLIGFFGTLGALFAVRMGNKR